MDSIAFSHNWNKKINCDAFTTIRKPSGKYVIGKEFDIYLNGIALKRARIVDIIHGDPQTLTEAMCRIDTGRDKDETLEILAKLYGGVPKEIFYITLLTTHVELGAFKLNLANAIDKLSHQIAAEHTKRN